MVSALPPTTPTSPRNILSSATTWALFALASGLTLGIAAHGSQHTLVASLGSIANALGELWISALQMVALPLALALTLAATASATSGESGSLGVRAIALFLVMLVAGAAFAALTTQGALGLVLFDTYSTPILPPAPAAAADAATQRPTSWWLGLVPRNIFAAASRGDIFPLLLFAILFGIAVARLPDDNRLPLTRLFQSTSQALLTMVRWLLKVTPFGVFILSFVIALNTGASWARLLSVYLLLRIGITLACVVLLYPISALLGRTSLGTFARAVFPAQLVAVSTRSSLASLPALIAGGRQHMGFTAMVTDFVLPLGVSLFRIGTVMANPLKLLFLAQVYDVALGVGTIIVFIATEIVFSLSAAGIPNSGAGGGGYRMLPVFAAAGVPIEGVIMLDAVETIPDIFETLANVTGQMSAATILSRDHALVT